MRLRLSMMVCACLTVTAAALRPSLASPLGGLVQRARRLVAQEQGLPAGWSSAFDETRGATYYVNEQTRESQWEPPAQQQGSPASQQGGYVQQGGYESPQELPSGWTRSFDEASQSEYYVNEQTGESQWEAPSPQPGPPQPAAQPAYPRPAAQQTAQAVVWRMASASGWGPRFAGTYKLRLGDEEYLGRYDMDLQKPTRPWVSRKQCLVYVGADGAALTLTLTLALILTLTLTLTLTLRLTRCRWRRQPGLVRPVPAHTVARARR